MVKIPVRSCLTFMEKVSSVSTSPLKRLDGEIPGYDKLTNCS